MKTLLFSSVLVILFAYPCFGQDKSRPSPSRSEEKPTPAEIERIQIFEPGQRPRQYFHVVSPVSEKEDNEEKAFQELKIKAVKLNADAIIDYKCGPVSEEGMWTGVMKVRSYCNGKAVKWTGQ
jgi:hypothetical protein